MSKKIKILFDFVSNGAESVISSFKSLNSSIGDASESLKKFDLKGFLENSKEAGAQIKTLGNSLRTASLAMNPYVAGAAAVTAAVTGLAIAHYKAAAGSAELYKQLKTLQSELGVTEDAAYKLIKAFSALGEKAAASYKAVLALVNSAGAPMDKAIENIEKFAVILSKSSLEKLSDGLEEYASSLKSFGFSTEQMTNAMASLIQNSQNADKFFNGFMLAIENLRSPSQELSDLLKQIGAGDVPKELARGGITAKQAFDKVADAILKVNKNGKDVSAILQALSDSLGESGVAAVKFYREGVEGSVKLTKAQKELLDSYKEVSAAIAYRSARGKEAASVLQQEEVSTNRLRAAWINLLAAFQNSSIFITVNNAINALKDSLANLLKGVEVLFYILGNQQEKQILNQYLEAGKKAAAQRLGKEEISFWDKIFDAKTINEELAKARDKYLKDKRAREAAKNIPIKPDGAKEPMISGFGLAKVDAKTSDIEEYSSLKRAEELLELSYKKRLAIIEENELRAIHTKEEANFLRAKLEEEHFNEVVKKAKELQNTTTEIDGKSVRLKKLTEAELREIEIKSFEFKDAMSKRGLELAISVSKEIAKIEKHSIQERLGLLTKYLERQKALLETSYRIGNITFYQRQMELVKLQSAIIDVKINEEKQALETVLRLETLTNDEREALIREANSKIQSLYQERTDIVLANQDAILERMKEMNEEAEKLASENFQKIWGGSTGFSVVDGFKDLTRSIQRSKDEISKLNEEINKLTQDKLAAEANKDFSFASAAEKLIKEKISAAELEEEAMQMQKIAYAFEILKQGAIGLTSLIVEGLAKEIDALNIQIEKRKEILEIERERFNVEEARLKNILKLEEYRSEQRQAELEALRTSIPEAQKEMLDTEIKNENERTRARREQIEANLQDEKRRIKDIEYGVKRLENMKLEMQEKQFETERAGKIAQAVMDGALAIVSLWANPGFPLSIPLSAVVGGLTAANVAAIASQRNPYTQRFAKGTLNVRGGKEGEDSVPALLMPGEAVIPKETNMLYKNAISAIYNKSVPPSVFDYAIKSYNSNSDIVDAINKKPVSVVSIDENGFTEYIIKKIEDYYYIKNKLGF